MKKIQIAKCKNVLQKTPFNKGEFKISKIRTIINFLENFQIPEINNIQILCYFNL